MIDPLYIKLAAVASGAALLLWPLVPKAFAAIKAAMPSRLPAVSSKPTLIDATSALSLVKAYLASKDKDVEAAIDTLAVAVVKKGL